jgi:hypothetical protein
MEHPVLRDSKVILGLLVSMELTEHLDLKATLAPLVLMEYLVLKGLRDSKVILGLYAT